MPLNLERLKNSRALFEKESKGGIPLKLTHRLISNLDTILHRDKYGIMSYSFMPHMEMLLFIYLSCNLFLVESCSLYACMFIALF